MSISSQVSRRSFIVVSAAASLLICDVALGKSKAPIVLHVQEKDAPFGATGPVPKKVDLVVSVAKGTGHKAKIKVLNAWMQGKTQPFDVMVKLRGPKKVVRTVRFKGCRLLRHALPTVDKGAKGRLTEALVFRAQTVIA